MSDPRDPRPPATDELLKSAEVARLLRVHPKQIYRLLEQGLPARRVGAEWRFLRDEVLAWSARQGGAASTSTSGSVSAAGGVAPTPATPARAAVAPAPLLAANGDLVVELLLAALRAEQKPLVGFVQADRGEALELLAAGVVLFAGFHGDAPPTHVAAARLARVHLVDREVGLAHPRAARLGTLADLAGKRLASRAKTAGVRAHFDRALAAARLTEATIGLAASTAASHRDAVCAVLRGEADAALTTSAWAARVGLGFFPLARETYDLVLLAEHLGAPEAVAVCEIAQSRAFHDALAGVPGYDPAGAGAIRYDFDTGAK